MSDFCGLLARAGVPADLADAKVRAMLDAHGRAHAVCHQVTPAPGLHLGFASLKAFHEEVAQRGQVTARDNLIVFGDVSIWHRQGTDPQAGPRDDVTYLHRWLRSGRSLATVNGDFCGGAFDQATGLLTLFRDQIGQRTVYYTQQPEGLWFASNLKFFHGLHAMAETVDHLSLAMYAIVLHPGQGRSYFKNIHQVQAAHQLQVTPGGSLRQTRYWSLDTTPNTSPKTVDEAVDHIREKLEHAVAARIADAKRPGTTLSGGLDSTTVTALVAKLRPDQSVPSFSHHAPDPDDPKPEGGDWQYIDEVLQTIPGLDHHFVTSDHLDILSGPEYFFDRALQPSNDLFFHGTQALFDAALAEDVDVVVDGMFGDYGFSITADPILWQSLVNFNLPIFAQEVRRRFQVHDRKLMPLMRHEFLRPLVPAGLVNAVHKWRGIYWAQRTTLRREWAENDALESLLFENSFAEVTASKLTMAGSVAQEIQYPRTSQLALAQDYVTGDRGVRVRNPLADIELLQALYHAPYAAFTSSEYDRAIARRVAHDLLPPGVRTRETKDVFAPSLVHRLLGSTDRIQQALHADHAELATLYDMEKINAALKRIQTRNRMNIDDFFGVFLIPNSISGFLRAI